jgi:FAD binding domain/Berberine and berberine like
MPTGLQQAIRGRVFERGAAGFQAAAHVFDPRFDHVLPDAVARPVDGLDVRDAIRFCTSKGIGVRARSGGHSYAGYSTAAHGVVLDLRELNAITVDRQAGTTTVGAGVQLIDLYSRLAQSGVTVPGGSCPSVGIAGVTLGGGFGLAARHLGLTIDSLRAAKIVTADGTLHAVDAQSDPDLLWALKGGGGGNFGVVTEFTFATHPMPASSTFFKVAWPWSSAEPAIAAWQSWAPHANDKITAILHVESAGPDIYTTGQYLGPSAHVPGLVAPLMTVHGASLPINSQHPYLATQMLLAGCEGRTLAWCHTAGAAPGGQMPREIFQAKSDYVTAPLPAPGRAAMIAAAETAGSGDLLCDAYGGAIARVGANQTAFVHRGPLFCIQYYSGVAATGWVEQASTKLRPYVSGHAYQNYIDPNLQGWEQAYYGNNLARLKQTRTRVDPHHYFNFPQAVGR